MPDAIPDFWRMIWEQESFTVVKLSRETEKGKVWTNNIHYFFLLTYFSIFSSFSPDQS